MLLRPAKAMRRSTRMLLLSAFAIIVVVAASLPGASSQTGSRPAKIKPLGRGSMTSAGTVSGADNSHTRAPQSVQSAPSPSSDGPPSSVGSPKLDEPSLDPSLQSRGSATYGNVGRNDYSAVGKFFIQGDTGNVGIGDAFSSRRPPSKKLEVDGDVFIAGGLRVDAAAAGSVGGGHEPAKLSETRLLIDDSGSVLFNVGHGGTFEVREATLSIGGPRASWDDDAASPRVSLLNGHYVMARKATIQEPVDEEDTFTHPIYIDIRDNAAIDCTVFATVAPYRGEGKASSGGRDAFRASMHRAEFFISLFGTDLFHQTVSTTTEKRRSDSQGVTFDFEYDVNYFNNSAGRAGSQGAGGLGGGASPGERSLRVVVGLKFRFPLRNGALRAVSGVRVSSVTSCRGDGMTGVIS